MPFFDIDFFTLLTTVFWVWMLIDCLFNPRVRGGNKAFWFLFILFTHFFGAIIYFFMKCTMRNPAYAFPYYLRELKQVLQQSGTPPQPPYQYRPPSSRASAVTATLSIPTATPTGPQPSRPESSTASPYADYSQGYQYQPPTSVERVQPQPYEPRPSATPEPEYEQTMISYPEMPPQA